MSVEEKYPEHQKLFAIKDKSQAIGDFIEWLRGKGYGICQKYPRELSSDEIKWGQRIAEKKGIAYAHPFDWLPANLPIQETLAEFYGIDLSKLEQEKRAMLEEMRKQNSQN